MENIKRGGKNSGDFLAGFRVAQDYSVKRRRKTGGRSRLTWLIANWCFRNRKCFTCQFRSQYRRTRREIFPILSRMQTIGYEMGKNGRTPEWYRANHRTPWVASHAITGTFSLNS